MAALQNISSYDVSRLQRLLDESETQRSRINRRMRMIRSLLASAKAGETIDVDAAIAGLPRMPHAPALNAPRKFDPQPAPAVLAPSSPFAGHMGAPLAAGVSSPVQPPPSAPLDLPSVDVGRLRRMSPDQLDALPYGVVTLDSTGRIIGYNDAESRMAGLPADAVIGRHFFGEVAPCTAVRDFEGRFRSFAEGRSRLALETFEFVFNFHKGAQRVVIMISPARSRGNFHVSMLRR